MMIGSGPKTLGRNTDFAQLVVKYLLEFYAPYGANVLCSNYYVVDFRFAFRV